MNVSTRLVASLMGAAAFTILTSAVAVDAFVAVRRAFSDVTETHLPVMVAAFELAQESEATAAGAAALAGASAQDQRQSAVGRFHDQERRLDILLDRLRSQPELDQSLVDAIAENKRRLARTYEEINVAAEGRIADETAKHALMQEVVELHDVMERYGPAGGTAAYLGERALDLLILASIAPDPSAFAAHKGHYDDLIQSIPAQERAASPVELAAIMARIEQIGQGTGNVFQLRRRELETAALMRTLGDRHAAEALRLSQSVNALIGAARADIEKADELSTYLIDAKTNTLVILSVVCVFGVLVVAVYVSRSIISRLDALKKSMVEGAAGHAVAIDTGGSDEITDMAKALEIFVGARDRGEEALRESERRFRDIAEAASEWLWEMGADLRFTFLSKRAGQDHLQPPATIGKSFDDTACRSEDEPWAAVRADMAARRPIRDFRFRYETPGGHRHVKISGNPIWSSAGAFRGYRGTGQDITTEVEAENRAMKAQRRLIDAVENFPAGFVLWGEDGWPVLANSRYYELFPPGGPLPERPPRDPAGSTAIEREHNGRWLHIREHETGDGCTVGIFADVTEMKVREAELREARDAAEQASQTKTRFLAAASHDLRQPLQALGLFVATLAERPLPPEDKAIVAKLQATSEALESLLDALLDISKLEAGVVEPEAANFSLSAMLTRLAQEFAPVAEAKDLRLRLRTPRISGHSDPALFERILRNLISNAIRYTETGGILIACRRRGRALRVEVWDSGRGIAAEHLGDIFREFHRVEEGGRPVGNGIGLGLAIVERTTRLLDHPLDVRSQPGQGSRFAVTLPLADGAPPIDLREARRDLVDFYERFVLVIDDDARVRDGLRMLLEAWGCRVAAVESGAAALAELTRRRQVLDAIIADYRLGARRTGIAAIAAVRKRLGAPIPAIIITGDMVSPRLRHVDFPLLHKPVRPEDLRHALHQAFTKPKPTQSAKKTLHVRQSSKRSSRASP